MKSDPKHLEVGTLNGQVVINHPLLDLDAEGRGHIVFSSSQALELAAVLMKQAAAAQTEKGFDPSDDDFEIRQIEILFAMPVKMTPMIQRQLAEIVDRMARATESEKLVHWAAGFGARPIWNEPHEPTWDDSVYQISTSARERYPTDKPFKAVL